VPYSTTISAVDFSGGVTDVRVEAGYTWTEVGGPAARERKQAQATLDIPAATFVDQTAPATLSYAGNFVPTPSPAWFVAVWIQEIRRIPGGAGWLFRSGRFETEPPAEPIEVILAPEELVGNAELASAVGTLPITSGATTITALTLTVAGADVRITAAGTDTRLPAGATFTFTATLVLVPNGSLEDLDSPFDIAILTPSLSFTPGGAATAGGVAWLNVLSGVIYNDVAPRVKATIKSRLNSSVLSQVATRLGRGTPPSLPSGVVLSIRGVRATSRSTPTGPVPVIGVLAALAAFGGVLNKFPAVSGGGGGRPCFIATAASTPHAPDVQVLTTWRDVWLRQRRAGAHFVTAYERVSPALARFIARSDLRRTLARTLIVTPAAWLARRLLQW
jgi:hypothetical protein